MEPAPPPPTDTSPPRSPEHELRDRARAAKLRHKAAKARLKAKRMEDRSKVLFERATSWEARADELDGVVRAQPQAPVDE